MYGSPIVETVMLYPAGRRKCGEFLGWRPITRAWRPRDEHGLKRARARVTTVPKSRANMWLGILAAIYHFVTHDRATLQPRNENTFHRGSGRSFQFLLFRPRNRRLMSTNTGNRCQRTDRVTRWFTAVLRIPSSRTTTKILRSIDQSDLFNNNILLDSV